MKSNIHPKYYPEAEVKCSCGHRFTTGSTKSEITVEVCYKCHPFYSGEQRYLDTKGLVETFKKRQETAKKIQEQKKKQKKKEAVKKKESVKTLKELLESI